MPNRESDKIMSDAIAEGCKNQFWMKKRVLK